MYGYLSTFNLFLKCHFVVIFDHLKLNLDHDLFANVSNFLAKDFALLRNSTAHISHARAGMSCIITPFNISFIGKDQMAFFRPLSCNVL